MPSIAAQRQALAHQIQAAFRLPQTGSDAPPSGERTIQHAVAEQPPELQAALLIADIHSNKRRSHATELWYWSELMLRVLKAPWQAMFDAKHAEHDSVRGLIHSTVYGLRANPVDIAQGVVDVDDVNDAPNVRARLTPVQRTTLSRFLGLLVTSEPFRDTSFADLASQAIRWCWADDAASLKAAVDMAESQRSYFRAPHDSSTFEDRIQAVERAFADTPYPTGELMVSGWDEPSEYELVFRGTDWRRLSPTLIDRNTPAFSFMTDQAFRYFIPTVLCHHMGPGTGVDIEFHLVDLILGPADEAERIRQRLNAFTADERWAIVNVLHFEAMMETDPDRLDAYEAAMCVWEAA